MPKAKNVPMSRQGEKAKGTRVKDIRVRENKVVITIELGKADALGLAKAIRDKWGKR